MTNSEIVNNNLNLILQCVDCQFSKVKDKQFKSDFTNDLILILLEYDEDKMNDAVDSNHFNALVTAIIRNNLFSSTSRYYATYKKFDLKTTEITNNELDIPDE